MASVNGYRLFTVLMGLLTLLAAPTRQGLAQAPGEATERPPEMQPGRHFQDCPGCPQLVVVPTGSFMMGSLPGEAGRFNNESPQQRVALGQPFAVGVHEVTRGQYSRSARETGHPRGDACWAWDADQEKAIERPDRNWQNPGFEQTDRHPVVCVNWDDAQAYVRWLSGKTGHRYRLLSESEWEYVARGGTATARYWGETQADQCRHANGADARTPFKWRADCDDGQAWTAPVGNYTANGFGLYDTLGNVWEWVQDCWNKSYAGAPSDGQAWERGECGRRVVRGGSWIYGTRSLRSASRSREASRFRFINTGFRVARPLDP